MNNVAFRVLAVNELCPLPNPGHDLVTASFSSGAFDIFNWITEPTSREITVWRKHPLQCGVLVDASIPFFIVLFSDSTREFDASLRLSNNSRSDQYSSDEIAMDIQRWIEDRESSMVGLYLCDVRTGKLKAMRHLGLRLEMMLAIKDACREQYETQRYPNMVTFNRAVESAYRKYRTVDSMLSDVPGEMRMNVCRI